MLFSSSLEIALHFHILKIIRSFFQNIFIDNYGSDISTRLDSTGNIPVFITQNKKNLARLRFEHGSFAFRPDNVPPNPVITPFLKHHFIYILYVIIKPSLRKAVKMLFMTQWNFKINN